jgi:hypothetical protein
MKVIWYTSLFMSGLAVASLGYLYGWWSDVALVTFILTNLICYLVGRLSYPMRKEWFILLREYLLLEEKKRNDIVMSREELERQQKMLSHYTNLLGYISDDPLDQDGHCKYCGSCNTYLVDYPYDPDLHKTNCFVPQARLLATGKDVARKPVEEPHVEILL